MATTEKVIVSIPITDAAEARRYAEREGLSLSRWYAQAVFRALQKRRAEDYARWLAEQPAEFHAAMAELDAESARVALDGVQPWPDDEAETPPATTTPLAA